MRKNLTENKVIAIKIFNVNVKTLIAFIKRDLDAKNEDKKKMLQDHEKNAFNNFISSKLESNKSKR